MPPRHKITMTTYPDILCIGAMMWDIIGRSADRMGSGWDVPGRIAHVPGGVALNVALALARMGARPAVLSAVGRDAAGNALTEAAAQLGVLTGYLARDTGLPTDSYMVIEDSNGLIAAIADAHSLEAAGEAILAPLAPCGALADFQGPVIVDGNLTEDLLSSIVRHPRLHGADLRIVPASPGKARRLIPMLAAPDACFYVNRTEAELICGARFADAAAAARGLAGLGATRAIVTDGAAPVAEARAADTECLTACPPAVTIARVTGAGDTFLAAHITAERAGADRQSALNRAAQAAADHVSGKDPT